MEADLDSGSYLLIIKLRRKQKVKIGKLGVFDFPAGYYLYTGSAMRNLRKRVARHQRRRNKKLRWHIDFLLNNQYAVLERTVLYPSRDGQECRINRKIQKLRGGEILVRRFGASDCKSDCGAHLIYFSKRPQPLYLSFPYRNHPY